MMVIIAHIGFALWFWAGISVGKNMEAISQLKRKLKDQ